MTNILKKAGGIVPPIGNYTNVEFTVKFAGRARPLGEPCRKS